MDLFSFIASFFSKDFTNKQLKQRRLKEIKNELNKKSKLFNVSKIQANSNFAKLLYGFYKIFTPIELFAKRYKSSREIIYSLVERYLNGLQKKSLDFVYFFSSKDSDFSPNISKNLDSNLSYLFKSISQGQIKLIDETYSALCSFFDLVFYNYYLVLRRFDSSLPENDFIYKPRFLNIGCGFILDDLKDFLECIYCIRDLNVWKNLYEIFSNIYSVYSENSEFPIKYNVWIKAITSIIEINKNNELLNIIRYVSGDLDYSPSSVDKKSRAFAKSFFSDLGKRVSNEIEKIKAINKDDKSKTFASKLFSGIDILKFDNYNEKMHLKIISKLSNSSGYVYYKLLSYIQTYAVNFVKKDLQGIVNLLIIKGQWKNSEFSRRISDNMYSLLNYHASFINFDKSLVDQGNYTHRINAILHRLSLGDKSSEKLLFNIISNINKRVLVMINEYYAKVYSINQYLKELVIDYGRPNSEKELIYNWKDIDIDIAKTNGSNSINFESLIKEILNNLDLFLKLMGLYLENKRK